MTRPAVMRKYVYCIIGRPDDTRLGAFGIDGDAGVHAVAYRDIAALVSDTPRSTFEPTPDNLLRHGRVSEEAMRAHTVIPLSFGTVFRTAEDLVAVLSSAYEALRDVLSKMEGKIQRDLQVHWNAEQVLQEVEESDPCLKDLRREITTRPGSTYFARVQYGRLVDTLLHERSQRYSDEVLRALRDVSEATRTNKPTSERTVLDASFLVTAAREGAFDARLGEVARRFPHLRFESTGPCPPYHFVNMRLRNPQPEPS